MKTDDRQRAVIVGAGLVGLTAAYELLKSTDIRPVIMEQMKKNKDLAIIYACAIASPIMLIFG